MRHGFFLSGAAQPVIPEYSVLDGRAVMPYIKDYENRCRIETSLRPAPPRADLPRRRSPPGPPRSDRCAALRLAQYQDRRLSRGLRLLLPKCALSDGRGSHPATECRRSEGASTTSQATRSNALLHGSRVAECEGWTTVRPGSGNGSRGSGAGYGSLRHARDVKRRTGEATEGSGIDRVQP